MEAIGRQQIENLVEGRLIGEQLPAEQFVSGLAQNDWRQTEALANGGVGVIGEPLGVGDDEEEEIQDDGVPAAALEVSMTEKSLIDPTELVGDAAQSLGAEGNFADHRAPEVEW